MLAILGLMLSAGAGGAPAQVGVPLGFDPRVARQGTTLLVRADESLLSQTGRPADSVSFVLPHGMRIDTASRQELCQRRQAARSACPESSRIGFGRFGLAVRGYMPDGGEAELVWGIDAYLGEPERRGDVASVVLIGRLLGADTVAALLTPSLKTKVPSLATTVGRLVRASSGQYGVELQFAKLPVQLDVVAPITATPRRLELSLGAVRRTRQNFTRRFKIRTPTGYEIRKIPDHRLIGHYLFRTPPSCRGSWPSEVRARFAGVEKRTTRRITCFKAGTAQH
ncbi:MAG TPA: hypothetical protein VFT24_09815 [Vicinamibacterales bacterium]|nr:hypothetical protein [Vicinamibacterales bacterium]